MINWLNDNASSGLSLNLYTSSFVPIHQDLYYLILLLDAFFKQGNALIYFPIPAEDVADSKHDDYGNDDIEDDFLCTHARK